MSVWFPHLPVGVDPLIKEARQRMRRRRLLLAAGLATAIVFAVGLTLALRPARSYPVGWVPQGVLEIDVRTLNGSPPTLRITDPSKVKQVIGWFDALTTGHVTTVSCFFGVAPTVSFTFRSADGRALGSAHANAYGASPCNPTYFTAGTQSIALVDPGRDTFVGRVERLLGVKFPRPAGKG
jgi:hypothetical protein